jgi:hypothetical protein
LIEYITKTIVDSYYEILLSNCRATIWNGGTVEDLLCGKECVSFYFFMMPRYIQNDVVATTPYEGVGRWDMLLQFTQYFGLQSIDLRVETTFTKVNYATDSPFMNLKISCRTVKDRIKVYELLAQKVKKWVYPDPKMKRYDIKLFDKQLNRDINSKPIVMGLIFSTALNKGTAHIKLVSAIDYDTVVKVFKKLKQNNEQSIFGKNFDFKESSTGGCYKITLTNIDKHVDEISVNKYFKSLQNIKLFSPVQVLMEKEEPEERNIEVWKAEIDLLIRKIIKCRIRDTVNLADSFNLYMRYNGYYLKYGYLKECEIKLTSRNLADAIKDCFDGKYYPRNNTALTSSQDDSYPLGKQFTHIVTYDKPEFHLRKKIFNRIRGLLENINNSIKDKMKKDYDSPLALADLALDKSYISWDEERLNIIQDDEDVKLTVVKGRDQKIANRLESVMREYFCGYEMYIPEKHYSYFFG